ncbi:GNAT family N-acetyltransferase [Palleronia caenipelagi]|uniref:L-ornithine N(alpha)-acyltransferase n=1 Tax=Palleronia caenipelagi TaxID=2489174 RepID=A0A547Q670_9RHOB|nr:GNAT family N-acyltransferase [Palleronia caenipelagi]TRD21872.1 GNAT family N-acetyltransferase [Palleronia caenipelagi]
MTIPNPSRSGGPTNLSVRLAETADDLRAAQRLRFEVFVEELGGSGELTDHDQRIEADRFDPLCRHLLLEDAARAEDDRIVGVYRLMTAAAAEEAGGFYSESEYDLTPLRESGRRLLELGRSCLHRDYRGGDAMVHLWGGLAELVATEGAEILFGVASFHGTDAEALAGPLSILHHRYLAPPELRVTARLPEAHPMDLLPEDQIDRVAAMRAMPSLIKGYLRLGGMVGEGAWIDRQFNTTDVCLIMDTASITERGRALYGRGRA